MQAFEYASKAHAAGCKQAAWLLGRCYKDGIGTERDQLKARQLLKQGADSGDPFAMVELGWLYEYSASAAKEKGDREGEQGDRKRAESLRDQSAALLLALCKRGSVLAKAVLGWTEMQGAEQRQRQWWLKEAAEAGHAEAQRYL